MLFIFIRKVNVLLTGTVNVSCHTTIYHFKILEVSEAVYLNNNTSIAINMIFTERQCRFLADAAGDTYHCGRYAILPPIRTETSSYDTYPQSGL